MMKKPIIIAVVITSALVIGSISGILFQKYYGIGNALSSLGINYHTVLNWIVNRDAPDSNQSPQPQSSEEMISNISTPVSYNDGLTGIVSVIQSQEFASESERIDFIREFVNNNSLHGTDPERAKHRWDEAYNIAWMYQYYLTEVDPPQLTCGPRASVMREILNELDMPNHRVMIFTDDFDWVESHTFIEVYNFESGDWEVHDPDFNIYYIDKNSNRRLTTLDIVYGELANIVPVSSNGLGWEKNGVEINPPFLSELEISDGYLNDTYLSTTYLRDHFFEAVMLDGRPDDRVPVVLVNSERFSLDKVFPENEGMTFAEFCKQNYGDIYFIAVEGDVSRIY